MTTASEKLKALGMGFDRVTPIMRKTGPKTLGADAYVHAKDIHAYVDALPQIATLIEAVERTVLERGNVGTIYLHGPSILPALTALNKALS